MRLLMICVVLLLLGPARVTAQSDSSGDGNVRLLIVMGGGTYENSVFRFFDTLGIAYTLVMSQEEAFATELSDRYDAVLMYNLSATLTEPGRTHLVEFLEGGGGLVVWHHALANYADWSWWHESVVGARYYMTAEAGHAASTYRQDESMVATPQKAHPVVAALGGYPMHLYGETYQDVWYSDEIDVLLRTALSTSDGPLVWVGPYKKARVVGIQPGHGSSEYYNLGFRLIMRDAIAWVAGQDTK